MSSALSRAQVAILARMLGADPESLASLARLSAHEIETLRSAISTVLYDRFAPVFGRVSKLAPLVPDKVAAMVAMKVIPPEIAGRGGGAIGLDHQHRAEGLLRLMSPSYLADAAPFLDPRVVPVFAEQISGKLLGPTARELLRRKDYVTAARFVEFANERLAHELHSSLDDDEGMIRTAALVMSADRINLILRAIPAQRLVRMGQTLATLDDEGVAIGLCVLDRIESELAVAITSAMVSALGDDGVARVSMLAVDHGVTEEYDRVMAHATVGSSQA